MAKEIAIGTNVTDYSGSSYTYGGPHPDGMAWSQIRFNMLTGTSTLFDEPGHMMPTADVPVLNLKDSRITIENRKAVKPRSAAGPWSVEVLGRRWWAKTKGEGLKRAAMWCAIEDWHRN